MDEMICLDPKYSTTRLVSTKKPVVENKPEEKFETVLFLRENEGRKGEGGLRTKGYFKRSYEGKPLITVITVVFNGAKYLEETIQSVINQTYENVEYIIIDGGSTDGTLDIIKKYEDAIDYWVSEKDRGIYDAMNKGIELTMGRYIIHINSGDYIDNKIVSKIFSRNINMNSLIIGNVKYISGRIFSSVMNHGIYFRNTIHHQSAFYPKSIFLKMGHYNLVYKILSDYHLNLRIYQNKSNIIKISGMVSMCSDLGVSDTPRFKNYKEEMAIRKEFLKNRVVLILVLNICTLTRFIVKKIMRKL